MTVSKEQIRAEAERLGKLIAKARRDGATDDEVKAITSDVKALVEANEMRVLDEQCMDMLNQMNRPVTPTGKGFAGTFIDGGFHYKAQPSVIVPAFPALGIKAPTLPDADVVAPLSLSDVAPLGRDARFLYPNLVVRDAADETAIDDFRETARSVTGTVERAIDATTDKAELATTIEHVVAAFKQWAVVLSDIPNAVLEARDAFRALFDGSMRYEVQKAIDAHAVAQILAASPPFGDTGTGLVAQIRNAVAEMRSEGAAPTLVALSPTDAAALDLFEDTGGSLVFATRQTGSSSPVWDLRVAEVAGLTDPLVIDPQMLGVFALASIRVDADPFTQFKKNLTNLRAETTGLMHVRNARGARRIAAV